MSYTTPIYDRDAADIAAQNSKAFWNVADWARVYNNTTEARDAINSALGITTVTLDALTTPTTADIPTASELNGIPTNIERLRSWLATNAPIADDDFVEIKDDYSAGQSETAPDYIAVNSWEKVIDLIYQIYKSPYTADTPPITGVAVCGEYNLGFE
ncbi:MAG: hypothetical protein DSY80_08955 [Desulfocapsa sp.]|nr:MAG: hypothetical protein DSY80_08955 [Desulfocapsa sp.]